MPFEPEKRKYTGVGTALITFAVIKSLKLGVDGIGLNSSLGVEGFYRTLGLQEQFAHDGKRTYFSLLGDKERCEFLEQRFKENKYS
jgi:hypothetical protein